MIKKKDTKLSFVIFSENNPAFVRQMKLLTISGYNGVELAVRDAKNLDLGILNESLKRNYLAVSAIGTGLVYIQDGLYLSALNKNIRRKAIERVKEHIDLSAILNSQVIIGLIRGKKEKQDDNPMPYLCNLAESISRLCDYAVSKKVILTLEPINRYETDFLHTAQETLSFVKKIGCSNLKVMLDTFHMNIEEKDMHKAIHLSARNLSHFHLADSNRGCPGEGHIDFKKVISTLKGSGYKGYLSGEIFTVSSLEACIRKFSKNVNLY